MREKRRKKLESAMRVLDAKILNENAELDQTQNNLDDGSKGCLPHTNFAQYL